MQVNVNVNILYLGNSGNVSAHNDFNISKQKSPEIFCKQNSIHDTQREVRKQMAFDTKNRGPPPPAPPVRGGNESSVGIKRGNEAFSDKLSIHSVSNKCGYIPTDLILIRLKMISIYAAITLLNLHFVLLENWCDVKSKKW